MPSAGMRRATCRITKVGSHRIIRSCHCPAVAYLQALGFVTPAWTLPPGLHDAERPSLPPYRRERYPDAEVYLAGRPALVSALVRGMWYSGCEVACERRACRPPSVWTATPSADGSHEIRLVLVNGGERTRFGGCPVSMIRGLGRGRGVQDALRTVYQHPAGGVKTVFLYSVDRTPPAASSFDGPITFKQRLMNACDPIAFALALYEGSIVGDGR